MKKTMFSIDFESMVKNNIMNIRMRIWTNHRISVCACMLMSVCVRNDSETISCGYNEIAAGAI